MNFGHSGYPAERKVAAAAAIAPSSKQYDTMKTIAGNAIRQKMAIDVKLGEKQALLDAANAKVASLINEIADLKLESLTAVSDRAAIAAEMDSLVREMDSLAAQVESARVEIAENKKQLAAADAIIIKLRARAKDQETVIQCLKDDIDAVDDEDMTDDDEMSADKFATKYPYLAMQIGRSCQITTVYKVYITVCRYLQHKPMTECNFIAEFVADTKAVGLTISGMTIRGVYAPGLRR